MYSQTSSHTQSNGWKRQSPVGIIHLDASISHTDRQPQRSAGDVSTTIKNLLVATKQLQEALKLWSTHQATETEVSNTYVTIGTEFNNVVTAFSQHKIDLRSVHNILFDTGQCLTQMFE
jgi:hypothetical protein